MAPGNSTSRPPRAPLAVPPPVGSTFATFVLYGSLAALLAALYAVGEWWQLAGGFGFPSDSAWARAVFARNVAAGRGLCFNPDVPVAGAPGPAWIGLLALAGLTTGQFLLSAKLLGLVCVAVAACVVWRLTLELLGDWRFAFVAGLLVAASPRLSAAALGGTEAALAALLLVGVLHWHAQGWWGGPATRVLATLALGLAALSRPGLILLLPLALLDRWLIAALHAPPGRRLGRALARSVPEAAGAALLLVPYLAYNWRAGGPLWQQPESAFRLQGPLAWAGATLSHLWADNAVALCAAAIGLPVAALSALRAHTRCPSLLPVLAPLALLIAPGLLWPRAALINAEITASCLTPAVALLGVSGLFAAHRLGQRLAPRWRGARGRAAFAGGVALSTGALFALLALGHGPMWREHGNRVKRVSDLQGYIGRWAGDHLPLDASIASREVGAIGFFSRRRMVDLGGTISPEGLAALSGPGLPDSNLLAYLQQVQPSHLAIRPADFPDLSRRADLLTPAVTCIVTDPVTGGSTTMTLYETPWPPASLRDAATLGTPGPR